MVEVKWWLALKRVEGIGDVIFNNIVAELGSPEAAFNTDEARLLDISGVRKGAVKSIREFSAWDEVDREIGKCDELAISIITLAGEGYSAQLAEIYAPPPVLYVKGGFLEDDHYAIAVVGSRRPDTYGKIATEKLAGALASSGVVIVSGMARGIDTIAHRAALDTGGRTIAVMGSGLDVIYPPENRRLFDEISQTGVVVSEFCLGTLPEAGNFPMRNRVISGLSMGVLVVQATDTSGSLITARSALHQNRDVFAVPGNITKPIGRGTNALIKRGAKLVEDASDILVELDLLGEHVQSVAESDSRPLPELSEEERAVYDAIGDETLNVDEVSGITGLGSSRLLSVLLSLELKGLIIQHPGKRFEVKVA